MLEKAQKIAKIIKNSGYTVYFAGGCVRDYILGIEPHDYDIATDATPDQIIDIFEWISVYKIKKIGESFGVILIHDSGDDFEIATFRIDIGTDGRRPNNVVFCSAEDDAKRRDITINGLFQNIDSLKIIDYVGGMDDIENKIIRFIGDPNKRIEEDHLRILRAIRFAIKFEFEIEESSMTAIKNNSKLLNNISRERIFEEITRILRLNRPHLLYKYMHLKSNVLKTVLPNVGYLSGLYQDVKHHPEIDTLKHVILSLENLPENPSDELLWATLLHDVGKLATKTIDHSGIHFYGHHIEGEKMARKILKELKCSNKFIECVCSLVGNHMQFIVVERMKKSTLRKFFMLPNFEMLMDLHRADCLGSDGDLSQYNFVKEKYTLKSEEIIRKTKMNTIISGYDLISLGMKPGPFFKEVLDKIETLWLEGEITTKDQAIEKSREIMAEIHERVGKVFHGVVFEEKYLGDVDDDIIKPIDFSLTEDDIDHASRIIAAFTPKWLMEKLKKYNIFG